MDFLSDDGPEGIRFGLGQRSFRKGKAQLEEKVFLLIQGIKGSEKGWMLI